MTKKDRQFTMADTNSEDISRAAGRKNSSQKNKDKEDHPIDAVITWVDGNDPKLIQKRKETLEKHGSLIKWEEIKSRKDLQKQYGKNNPSGKVAESDFENVDNSSFSPAREVATGRDLTRFIDNNELYYCIRSIRAFAPWIRRIFVVTDDQTPSFLTPEYCNKHNIRIVDHTEVFAGYEWALPTFNTRTIESVIWRIEGLAPRFISFNDDFLLTRPVSPEDFFQNGNVVLRGRWNRIIKYGAIRMKVNDLLTWFTRRFLGITRTMHLLLQMRSARLAGNTRNYFRSPHIPHPVKTDTLKSFFEEYPHLFEDNLRYRIRNTAQFSAIFLAHHLEINGENAILKNTYDQAMLNGEMDTQMQIRKKLKLLNNQEVRFACLHAFDQFSKENQHQITQVIDALIESETEKAVESSE